MDIEELQRRMGKFEERFEEIRNREIEFLTVLSNEGGDPCLVKNAKEILFSKIGKAREVMVETKKIISQRGIEIDNKLKEIEKIERLLKEIERI